MTKYYAYLTFLNLRSVKWLKLNYNNYNYQIFITCKFIFLFNSIRSFRKWPNSVLSIRLLDPDTFCHQFFFSFNISKSIYQIAFIQKNHIFLLSCLVTKYEFLHHVFYQRVGRVAIFFSFKFND